MRHVPSDPKKAVSDDDHPDLECAKTICRTYKEYIDSIERPRSLWRRIRFDYKVSKIRIALQRLERECSRAESNNSNLKRSIVIDSSYNLLKQKSWLDIARWSVEFKKMMHGSKLIIANIELRTGKHTHVLVKPDYMYFDYDNGRYFIDDDFKYYDTASQLFCLDYHQDCCLPLRRKFSLNSINEFVENNSEIETETSINPRSFKIFMESDIIQKVIKGAEMDQWISFVKIMLVVITIMVTILLFMNGKVLFGK